MNPTGLNQFGHCVSLRWLHVNERRSAARTTHAVHTRAPRKCAERMEERDGAGIGITKDLFCISHIICVPACHKEPLPVLTVHSQGRDSAALFEQPFLSPAEFVLTLQFAL